MDHRKKNDTILNEDARFILDTIESHKHQAMIVGGAVRNFLMDIEISDIDVATTALPTDIVRIFRKRGVTVIPVGIEHGTVMLVYKGRSYEITTLREDIKTFGRHAEVSFTKSFEIDSNRRDFTMNAIYMNKAGKLFDYHDSISDINARNVVFIGDPVQRIHEDYLRILRYFRFVAYYGNFKTKDEYISIIHSLKENVAKLSLERILAELLKTLQLQDSYKIIPQMRPVLDVLFDLQHDSLDICNEIGINDMSAIEKFCMMIKFSHTPIQKIMSRYSFPRNIKRLLLLECERYDIESIKLNLKSLKKDLRSYYIKYVLVKMYALEIASRSDIAAIRMELENFCDSEYVDFPLKASDFANFNLTSKQLGEVMRSTKKFWTQHSCVSRTQCLKHACASLFN